jgi:hypothetical protein
MAAAETSWTQTGLAAVQCRISRANNLARTKNLIQKPLDFVQTLELLPRKHASAVAVAQRAREAVASFANGRVIALIPFARAIAPMQCNSPSTSSPAAFSVRRIKIRLR